VLREMAVLRKVAPEMVNLVEKRWTILRHVFFSGPIGRRALAARMGATERAIRREVSILRKQGLLSSDPSGMATTPAAESLLVDLHGFVRELRGLADLEFFLKQRLDLEHVIVVPGDSDQDETVKKEMARETGHFLGTVLQDGSVIAVTGGTTLAEAARSLPPFREAKDVLVVPARGGLGEDVELQANSVAAQLARQLGASYRLLHVPEDLGEEAYSMIQNEPKIKELVQIIRSADIVIHGLGTAEEMARRRGLSDLQLAELKAKGAIGEAFGYYFNKSGDIVYTTSSAGLRYDDLESAPRVIAVGGGRSKAEAAIAVMSHRYQNVCITDEGAAREIMRILKQE